MVLGIGLGDPDSDDSARLGEPANLRVRASIVDEGLDMKAAPRCDNERPAPRGRRGHDGAALREKEASALHSATGSEGTRRGRHC